MNTNHEDHMLGNADAPLELIEYADYQCPYCGQAYYILKEITAQMRDKMKFIFRNFPIPELHAHAIQAAVAAEAAGAQHKFWEMHDKLFENQKKLSDADILDYAKQIGIDMKQFEKDIENKTYLQKVESDFQSGIKKGVQGTPTFFINGELYQGNWSDPSFLKYLQSLVK